LSLHNVIVDTLLSRDLHENFHTVFPLETPQLTEQSVCASHKKGNKRW